MKKPLIAKIIATLAALLIASPAFATATLYIDLATTTGFAVAASGSAPSTGSKTFNVVTGQCATLNALSAGSATTPSAYNATVVDTTTGQTLGLVQSCVAGPPDVLTLQANSAFNGSFNDALNIGNGAGQCPNSTTCTASGTTDTATPTATGTAAAMTGTNVTTTATASWAAAATTFTITSCTTVAAGMTVWDSTNQQKIGYVTSCTTPNLVITANGSTGGALAASFGAADSLTFSSASLALDTNTNLTGMPIDGSQAIALGSATNANNKMFFITDKTGCTGSGACSVIVASYPAQPVCSAGACGAWAVGGRIIMGGSILPIFQSSLRGGDTFMFNTSPAPKGGASAYLSVGNSGSVAVGFINIVGKTGIRPVLSETATQSILSITASYTRIFNLELVSTGNTTGLIAASGSNLYIDNVKFSGSTGTTDAVFINSTTSFTVTNSEITGMAGNGIEFVGNTSLTSVHSNYIHDLTGDCIKSTGGGANLVAQSNILANCGGNGINITGAGGTLEQTIINGNTIYGNLAGGLTVSNNATMTRVRNNIFQDNGNGTGYNASWLLGNAENGGTHSCNVFFQTNAGWPNAAAGGVLNLTVNSTEFTTNPSLIAPGTAAPNANFTFSSAASPAANHGCPQSFPNTAGLSYLDVGTYQRAHGSGGGGFISN